MSLVLFAVVAAFANDLPSPSTEELDAAQRLTDKSCGLGWGWAWPGASRFCLGRPVE